VERGRVWKIAVRSGGLVAGAGVLLRCAWSVYRLRRRERRLRELLDNVADAFFVHDDRGRILDANRCACESLGYTKEELRAMNVADIEQNSSSGKFGRLWDDMVPGVPVTVEDVHRRKDGSTFPVEVRVGLLGADGDRQIFAVARDVTARRRAEEALRESGRRFRQLFENSADALFVHDARGRILDCNAEACRSLGYEREELLAAGIGDVATDLLSEEERAVRGDGALWEKVMRGEPGRILGYSRNTHRRKDGTTFPVEVGVGAIEYGGRRAILASARDITARQEVEDELRRRAFHDPLTRLPNRALFFDRLEHALAQANRRQTFVALLFLDLDDFKAVNDTLGHEAGDQLLISVGHRVSTCVRAADTVARLAGDEFTVLLEDLHEEKEAARVAERVLKVLDAPFRLRGREMRVTASVGIACASSGCEPGELLHRADEAMYRAKQGGKARYGF
jgi:diguanylate cyclase (GGDEF)-like protein/PAS domain S-box-containing protein